MLVEKLKDEGTPYYIVLHDLHKAGILFDDKLSVFFGNIFEEETYSRLNIATAKMVFANQDAITNAHIALVIRQISDIPIVALIEDENSRTILEKAGCTHILPVKALLGESLSNRTMAGGLKSSVVGNFDKFEIAKIPVYSTAFQGKSISSLKITEDTNVKIVGIWERSDFLLPEPDFILTKSSILVLMGENKELLELNASLSICNPNNNPIIIIGCGAVGLSVAKDFDKNNVPYIIVDKEEGVYNLEKGTFLKGDASKPGVLEAAGIANAPSVAITTNDDGINSYLTIYCRLLNKDICIISRANYDKNLNSLYKAGADFVVPYNMIGSNMVYNIIHQRNLILRTEGLSIFKYKVSRALDHKTLKKSNIRGFTQCNVICLRRNDKLDFDIKDSTILYQDDILFLIGTTDQEHKFFNIFGDK
ncbi:MAG: potassium channel family protein [Candidatus Anammoxibacter sp.]